MGRFLNPDNSAFQGALNSEIYVDKTGLLNYTNKVLDTEQRYICNSRPRRFGKSMTANMLTAYYSRGCDSEQMFEGKAISRSDVFKEHLNKYDVIHFDVQWCLTPAGGAEFVVDYIQRSVIAELREIFADILPQSVKTLAEALSYVNQATGRKFIVIIDEWDVLIRDESASVQKAYINFLRSMFKGTEPTRYLHMVYLTGILPIKREKTQSALNNFDEFTMLAPGSFASYAGFTEEEVLELCEKYGQDFQKVKQWYDGYLLGGYHVYNPKAVVNVMLRGEFQSYWSQTGTYEAILPLINMDFDGLRAALIQMISGTPTEVEVRNFQNDMVSFADKDDVLTLLIHLGYLSYDREKKMAFIPNEEICEEFIAATRRKKWNELLDFQRKSKELLEATLDMDEEAVAACIEEIHAEYVPSIEYNDENSLSSVLTIGYLSAMQYYFMPIREMASGHGFADNVYLPKPEYRKELPALLVELKWNKTAQTALQQIKEKKYVQSVEHYTGDILLVGVNYSRKRKQHECVIEKYTK